MNTLEEDFSLDPSFSYDSMEPDISSGSNVMVNEFDDYYDEDPNLDITPPPSEQIEPSVQIAPKQQEQINNNSIESNYDPAEQMGQSDSNNNRRKSSDARFNAADGIGGSSVGNAGRLSSETKKPSPMASSRAMDTRLRLANNSLPEWRKHYI